ncbi:MAG: hypothetical protein KIT25_16970 [Enhydrobacter sp.]|nr:MAG: hypothetical protein KIT25_16970 [Enhydrobacter sp.]
MLVGKWGGRFQLLDRDHADFPLETMKSAWRIEVERRGGSGEAEPLSATGNLGDTTV